MAKYDSQIQDLPQQLASAKSILVCLPSQPTVDELASGTGLALALQKTGKSATVVTEANPTVTNSNLFGIGEVKNQLPATGAGNFVVTLENVVDPTGQMQTVPALEKLDWYPEGPNLNLVFHVIPGQRFEPSKVTSKHSEQGFDLIITLGTSSLAELGSIYNNNSSMFGQTPIVNIDYSSSNTNFGKFNIIDTNSSSVSEILIHLLSSLSLSMDQDIATNLITGLYDSTANLTQKVSADTFQAASAVMQAGASLPGGVVSPQSVQQAQPQPTVVQPLVQPQPTVQPISNPVPQSTTFSEPSISSSPIATSPWLTQEPQIQFTPSFNQPQPASTDASLGGPVQTDATQSGVNLQATLKDFQSQPDAQGVDLRQVFQLPQMPSQAATTSSQINSTPAKDTKNEEPQVASREERPQGEQTVSTSSPEFDGTPTPDWLVPKIFKGGEVG